RQRMSAPATSPTATSPISRARRARGDKAIVSCISRSGRATAERRVEGPSMTADAFAWADGGVRIAGAGIYCDTRRCPAEAIAFVSHARAPRLRGGADVRLVTTERPRLLRAIERAPR